MNERDWPAEEEIRRALGRFLDRLAKVVAEVLVRAEPGGPPPRRREAEPAADESEAAG